MHSNPEGMMDGSATDVRDVRLFACRPQTVLKKASGVYDGKTRSGFRGGNRALRAPLIGYEAYGTHRAEIPRKVGSERMWDADSAEKAREKGFSIVCTALILLVVCGKTGIQ